MRQSRGRPTWWNVTLAIGALASVAIAALLAVGQVNVSDQTLGITRACGSAFDGIVDRTGWESWWASDLDEPDPSVRRSLVRTTRCPNALNVRTGFAIGGLAAGVLLAAASWRRAGGLPGSQATSAGAIGGLARLGRATLVAGIVLTTAGLVALVVLVADRDSTLFLYTDRLVVGLAGLVVLIPPMSLLVVERALSLLSSHLDDSTESERPDGDDQ